MKNGKLFVISGPSGAGKTSLTMQTIKRLKSSSHDISKIITYTTRTPRPGEINGKDYNFLNGNDFKQKVKNNFFLEVSEYNGNLYGSPRSIIQDTELGKSFIVVVDRPGAKNYKKLVSKAIFIWIKVNNLETLKKRIISRNDTSVTQLKKRLESAKIELAQEEKQRLFNYHVVNENFEEAVNEIMQIVKKELSN